MVGGSQVHIFWGAPVLPLNRTVSQEPISLMSTADPWEKIKLLYNHHSLHPKDEKCKHVNLENDPVLDDIGSQVHHSHCSVNSRKRSVHVKSDHMCYISKTQNIKSQKSPMLAMIDIVDSSVQVCGFKSRAQPLTEEQKLVSEKNKITVEQHNDQSSIGVPNFKKPTIQLDYKCAALLDLVCTTKQVHLEPEVIKTTHVLSTPHEMQTLCLEFFPSEVVDVSRSKEGITKVSGFTISTNTEFLSVMTSSQVAFLAQGMYKEQKSLNKGTISIGIRSKASHEELRVTEENLVQLTDDFAEECESKQNKACSLELFSPVCPATKSNHILIKPDKDCEENIETQELFSSEEKMLPDEICIEPYNSGILCSQFSVFRQSSVKRHWTSEDEPRHSKTFQVAKKTKLLSTARDLVVTPAQKNMSEFKYTKKTTLIKNCDYKSWKYNCLVLVLSPCHVKEVNIKSGPNSGSKVPLTAITVIDQSEIRKKVFMWRTTAFWALTAFPGDVILLTDVTVYEDQWAGERALQSTFSSQLLNLGHYSSVKPDEYSSVFSTAVLQDLLAYVSLKHSCLSALPWRWPRKASSIAFVELEHLQPETLVHAVLRVVDVTVLTEELYSYRGQKQRKVVLTVEQVQGQHYMLVLWGPGAAWYPQLQRKKDYIWEFKFLFVHRNCISENLDLHTTPWSSYECLFDDDIRAIKFKAKFPKSVPSLVKMSDLATLLEEKCSGVVVIKAQISELLFPITAAQKVHVTLNAQSPLKSIFASLANITYTGCAKCGLELDVDPNKIYKQCLNCLPLTMKKIHYRPALMTLVDGRHTISVHVGSEVTEKIFLNISPDWLNKVIVPSSGVTYGMVAADLLHSLLAPSQAPCLLKIQSLFVLDENSFPLQQDFYLLDFYPECKAWLYTL
ncbi:LOW QUALITY PROTEIN: shieldin complex subunit 2 [Rhynchocyon petersi]